MAQLPADDQQQSSQHPVERQSAINAGIVALALAQLGALWPKINWADPDAAKTTVKSLYGAIVQKFGRATASTSAMLYDELRANAQAPGNFRATPADPVSQEQIDRIVESAWLGSTPAPEPEQAAEPNAAGQSQLSGNTGQLTAPAEPAGQEPPAKPALLQAPESVPVQPADEADEPTPQTTSEMPLPDRVEQRLTGTAERLVMQPGRDTIAQNVAADPAKVRYIRVPTGPNPCAFCVMLASRAFDVGFGGYGAHGVQQDADGNLIHVVTGKGRTPVASATGKTAVGQKYHNHCHCEPVPVFAGQSEFDVSPNMQDYQDMYQKASANAGTSRDTKRILAEMRRTYAVR